MVHNEELKEVRDFLENRLGETGLYRDIQKGGKVEGIDNRQKKRHVYAERDDGEEFLFLVSSDTMVDRDFRRKISDASERGIYVMPVFYRNETSQGDRVFFNWFRGVYRDSLEHLSMEERQKAVKTTKNERSAYELMEGNIVYFDDSGELQVYGMDFDVEASYYHRDDFHKNEAILKTAAYPEMKYSTSHFVTGRKEGETDYSLPIDLDELYGKIDRAERMARNGFRDDSLRMVDEARSSEMMEKFPEGSEPYTEKMKMVERIARGEGEQLSLF